MDDDNSYVKQLAIVDREVAQVREARAAEALRVTAGYEIRELRAFPDSALRCFELENAQLRGEIERLKVIYDELLLKSVKTMHERVEWEKRARDLEALCADRL